MTQEYLKQYYNYNQNTGLFTIIKQRNGNKFKTGHIISGTTSTGYLRLSYRGKVYPLHRLAFLYMNNSVPSIVDHIDRNILNNKWSNLREITKSGNCRNREKKSTNSTGRRGVFEIRKDYFQAIIMDNNGKRITFGTANKQKAIEWREEKETELGFY